MGIKYRIFFSFVFFKTKFHSPETHTVDQAGLPLTEISLSAFRMLEL